MVTEFITKKQAETLLSSMQNIIDMYGFVTVAELKDILGFKETTLRENHIGWTDIRDAEIMHTDNNGHYPRYFVRFTEPSPVVVNVVPYSGEVTYGDIYREFQYNYPDFAKDVSDWRPYMTPYTDELLAMNIILWMSNGEKKRYSYETKKLYPIREEE